MANITNSGNGKDVKNLSSNSPLVAGAQGATPNQAKMAMTPQARQGQGKASYPWTVKGMENPYELKTADVNVAWNPLAPGTTPIPGTQVVTPPASKTETQTPYSQTDIKTYLDYAQFQTEVTEAQKKAAKDQAANVVATRALGKSGVAINNLLNAEIDKIFSSAAEGKTLTSEIVEQIEDVDVKAAAKAVFDAQSVILANTTKTDKSWESTAEGKAAIENYDKAVGNLAISLKSVNADGTVNINWEKASVIFGDKSQAIGAFLSHGLANDIYLDDIFIKDGLDITDEAEVSQFKKDLAGYLNVPEEKLSSKSFGELAQMLESSKNKEYQRAMDLERAMHREDIPMAERQAILSELRSLGYTGTLASMDKMDRLAKSIEEADAEVNIGGHVYGSISEALDNTNIQGLVYNYLKNPKANSDLPAGLKAIIDQNKDAMQNIISQFQTEINDFNSFQVVGKELRESGFNAEASAALKGGATQGNSAFLTRGESEALSSNLAKSTLYREWKSANTSGNKELASSISSVANEVAAVLGKGNMPLISKLLTTDLDASEIKTLATDPGVRTNYMGGLKVAVKVQDIANNPGNYRDALSATFAAFGIEGITEEESRGIIAAADEAMDYKVPGSAAAISAIGSMVNPDGTVKSTAEFVSNMQPILDAGNVGSVSKVNGLVPGITQGINSARGFTEKIAPVKNQINGIPVESTVLAKSLRDVYNVNTDDTNAIINFANNTMNGMPGATAKGAALLAFSAYQGSTAGQGLEALRAQGALTGNGQALAANGGTAIQNLSDLIHMSINLTDKSDLIAEGPGGHIRNNVQDLVNAVILHNEASGFPTKSDADIKTDTTNLNAVQLDPNNAFDVPMSMIPERYRALFTNSATGRAQLVSYKDLEGTENGIPLLTEFMGKVSRFQAMWNMDMKDHAYNQSTDIRHGINSYLNMFAAAKSSCNIAETSGPAVTLTRKPEVTVSNMTSEQKQKVVENAIKNITSKLTSPRTMVEDVASHLSTLSQVVETKSTKPIADLAVEYTEKMTGSPALAQEVKKVSDKVSSKLKIKKKW